LRRSFHHHESHDRRARPSAEGSSDVDGRHVGVVGRDVISVGLASGRDVAVASVEADVDSVVAEAEALDVSHSLTERSTTKPLKRPSAKTSQKITSSSEPIKASAAASTKP
jgi:hypothetical protein